MKQFLTICLATLAFNSYSQCVLIVNGQSGNILIPFTENAPGVNVPTDINSKKWRNYVDLKALKSVSGEFSVFSNNGLVGKTNVISIDTSQSEDAGPYCGPLVKLSRKFSEGDKLNANLYAFKSKWNAQPRPVSVLSATNAAYEQAIKSILEQKAELKKATVVIKKMIKVDLDGDQKDEVIIQATNHPDIYNPHKGDYSLVIMRHLVNEKVVTDILNFQFIDHDCGDVNEAASPCWMTQYTISALLDLNGDGTMEILINDETHEGEGVTAYEFTPEGLKAVLGWGCGV